LIEGTLKLFLSVYYHGKSKSRRRLRPQEADPKIAGWSQP
jgi:hypothetical protein